MLIVSLGDNLHEVSDLGKLSSVLLSAKFAHIIVRVNEAF